MLERLVVFGSIVIGIVKVLDEVRSVDVLIKDDVVVVVVVVVSIRHRSLKICSKINKKFTLFEKKIS
jgi:hypothetical protein